MPLSRCRLPVDTLSRRLRRPVTSAPFGLPLPLITVSGPHLFTAVPDVLPSPRLPDGPRRLGEGSSCRHQVVDQHDQPFGQQPSAAGNHGQRAREVLQPLPGVEPRLVGHPPPLPQYGHHPPRHPRPPQLPSRRERDPPRRIMPPSPNRPPRGRHGNEQHRHTGPNQSPIAPFTRPPRPPRRKSPTARLICLPHRRRYRPRQSRAERPSEAQRPSLLMGQQDRPYRVRIPSRRVHDRQSGRLRHRSRPARCGPVQGGTALRTEHRARPPTASALGRQHQIGQVPPPPPHAHHCANAEADRPPLWITACGKLRSPIRRTRTTVPITNLWPPTVIRSAEHSPRISSPYKRIRTTNPPVRPTNPARPTSRESPPAPEQKRPPSPGPHPGKSGR